MKTGALVVLHKRFPCRLYRVYIPRGEDGKVVPRVLVGGIDVLTNKFYEQVFTDTDAIHSFRHTMEKCTVLMTQPRGNARYTVMLVTPGGQMISSVFPMDRTGERLLTEFGSVLDTVQVTVSCVDIEGKRYMRLLNPCYSHESLAAMPSFRS